jgi:hypothetical protein
VETSFRYVVSCLRVADSLLMRRSNDPIPRGDQKDLVQVEVDAFWDVQMREKLQSRALVAQPTHLHPFLENNGLGVLHGRKDSQGLTNQHDFRVR